MAIEGEVISWVGRPPKLTPEEKQVVVEAMQSYIMATDDPTVSGFVSYNKTAIEYNVTYDNIMDWQEFTTLRKIAIKKQEAYLVKGATEGKLNATFAIFRLKQPQHGWTDKQEVDQTIHMPSPIVGGMAKAQIEDGED